MPARHLKDVRLARFLSQQDLAGLSGVPPETISRIERGRPARLSTLRRLAAALGVSPAEIVDTEVR